MQLEAGAVQLAGYVAVVEVDGDLLGGDSDEEVAQLGYHEADGHDGQHHRGVEAAEFLEKVRHLPQLLTSTRRNINLNLGERLIRLKH